MAKKDTRPDRLLSIKEQFRRKEINGRKHKKMPIPEPQKASTKPKSDGRFFDPAEFAGNKPLMRDFQDVKGKQPEWVKLKYGDNGA